MKSMIIIVLFIICFLIPAVASHGFQNEPDSFRGIRCGTDISELSGMRIVMDKGKTKYYTKTNDEMELGGAQIDDIRYVFYEGKLHEVMLVFHDFVNFNNIRTTCFNLHGNPASYGGNYYWSGETTHISLTYNAEDKKGELSYVCVQVSKDILKGKNQ